MRTHSLLLVLLLAAPVAHAQDEVRSERAIPVDPSVRIGRLANGLTYIVRANERPEKRAELRLAVDAGSILEDDDQRGLAHFFEHMAFNGTARYPKQDLINYLESLGMRFGPDVNAYTSFDETVYMLQVRTDSVGLLDSALGVLREWADRVTLDPDEVEKERGVVLEEWRLGRGASARMLDRQLPVWLHGSRYTERMPIGDPAIIESASVDDLRRFYADWYRPDLSAVIAVGDFDPDEVVSTIESLFADWSGPDIARERAVYGVPGHDETLVSIETDPEAPMTQLRVTYKLPKRDETTEEGFRDTLVRRFYDGMLSSRLSERVQQADPPFIYGAAGSGGPVRTIDGYTLLAAVATGGVSTGLRALVEEAERVRRYGFTQSELDRQIATTLRYYEQAFNERDKSESQAFAGEYVRHFLEEEVIPGIEYEYAFIRKVAESLTLEELNALVPQLMTRTNRVVLVAAPEKDRATLPAPDDLVAIMDTATDLELEPYGDSVSTAPLVEAEPTGGSVVESNTDDVVGTTRLVLSNGVKVVLKPTDFKNDQVLMAATSPGGVSLVPIDDLESAEMAASIVGSSGVGAFGPVELQKKLAGRIVSVSPSISELSEGLRGSASPRDLETLFQLTYLYFTAPRADAEVFESLRTRFRGMLENRGATPEAAFQDTLISVLYQDHPRRQPTEVEDIEALDLAVMDRIYRERFADAGDFTFYFVGAFDVDEVSRLSARWLGSLPSIGRTEEGVDVGARPPDGVVKRVVRRGIEPKGQVRIHFTGPMAWSRDSSRLASVLGEAFRIKLREVLREDLGGTYGVSVSGSVSRRPYEGYQFAISFGCDPAREEELIATVFAEIEAMKASGLEPAYLQKVHEARLHQQETSIRENGYWLSALMSYDDLELDPHGIVEGTASYVAALSPEDLALAARTFLDLGRYVQVTLVPEAP